MRIRHRRCRLILVLVLLLALANAAIAQGGVWRCDTGQACVGHGSVGCCCPPERRSPGCDDDSTPNGGACPSAPEVGSRGASTQPDCCSGSVHSSTPPIAERLDAAPHCRCSYAISTNSEVARETGPLLALPIPGALPGSIPSVPPAPRVVVSATAGEPPPLVNLLSLAPCGSRAPPAC